MRVINILGEPSSGKSTLASEIFAMLKKDGYRVELVTEVAKDLVWEGQIDLLQEQDYVFAMQHRRLSRLKGKVDFVVTDSPLLMCLHYLDQSNTHKSFKQYALNVINSFDNKYILARREHKYETLGRIHTEKESEVIKDRINYILVDNNIRFYAKYSNMKIGKGLINYITEKGN